MRKVFLSHSSSDKHFVEPIADLLGKNKCIYDKYTFEIGMETIKEIFNNMENSDVFVYFISEKALESSWVKTELNKAKELLADNNERITQIFPLIIDDKIDHTDCRIAPFLRENYILQRVKSPILAYRKILEQLSKLEFRKDLYSASNTDYYYGRTNEIQEFKNRLDTIEPIKSLVVSGLPGIGKKSYIKHALIDAKIIAPYYEPIVLSFPKSGGIEDLIVSLSEAGFGSYSLPDIIAITDMEKKIEILTEIINEIQKYKEIVIVEDDASIVSLNGELKYWFDNAIKQSANGIAIALSSNISLDRFYNKHYKDFFFINLSELNINDRLGLLRTYSNSLNLELSQNDRVYFKDCLTGYPPQIIYCVEMIKDNGIEYAKDNTSDISNMPEQISSLVLERCIEHCDESCLYGILSLMSRFETVPASLISKICKKNPEYSKAIIALRNYSVCYRVGANGEYYKTNSFIENFVTRNHFKLPEDIKNILNSEMTSFEKSIENDEELAYWNPTELKYYIKESLKKGNYSTSPFWYSTIILQTLSELYNNKKYKQVISLVHITKSNDKYNYYDDTIQNSIQRYQCLALIKIHDTNFEAEVEYFKDNSLWIEYNYLKGFWYRHIGKYEKAKEYYLKVYNRNQKHFLTKQELVKVYIALQDYDAGMELARSNYFRRKDNIFNLQAYFECLIELNSLDNKQEQHLNEMICSLKRLHRINPSAIYFQLMSKYEAFHEHDLKLSIEYINQGLKDFPNNMYILRSAFDIYRRYKDINRMKSTYSQLENAVSDYDYKGVLYSRKAILDLYSGKSPDSVKIYLRDHGYDEYSIDKLMNKYLSS